MTHDKLNTAAARRWLAELLPTGTILAARYVPSGRAPDWARELVGVRALWVVDGGLERMTPWPLATTAHLERHVDYEELREAKRVVLQAHHVT